MPLVEEPVEPLTFPLQSEVDSRAELAGDPFEGVDCDLTGASAFDSAYH